MRYRTLGATGIQVTPYCLGAMMFGSIGNPDHDDSIRIIHRALDAGINFIDTADMHSRGESELIVGNALKGRRDNVVVATKVNGPMGEDPNMRGTSRRWIMTAVEGSLRRLQTDYIDLYQTHRLDPTLDKEETLSALTDLVRAARSAPSGPPPSPPPTSSWALAFAITHPLTPSEPQHYADARQMPATRHNRQPASLAAPSRRASALAVLPVSAVLHPRPGPFGTSRLMPAPPPSRPCGGAHRDSSGHSALATSRAARRAVRTKAERHKRLKSLLARWDRRRFLLSGPGGAFITQGPPGKHRLGRGSGHTTVTRVTTGSIMEDVK